MKTTRRTPAARAASSSVSVPVTLTAKIDAREAWIGSAAAAWTSTSAPATSARAAAGSRTSPRRSSTTASSPRIVERRHVERPHVGAVGEQPPREVETEEAGAAGDRPEHGGSVTALLPARWSRG